MEHLNFYNAFIPIILTQSSQRRRETDVITKLCVPYILSLIFIMIINMKEKFDFLITYGSLRPLRLCVRKLWNKVFTFAITG